MTNTDDKFGLPELPTVKQWADAFQVAPLTIYREIERGNLTAVKVGTCLRICRDKSLEQVQDANSKATVSE